MSKLQSPDSPRSRGTLLRPPPTRPDLIRILLIGPELRVEELRALLSEQEDMQFLPSITDRDQALDVPSRTNLVSRIHVVIIEWEFCEEQHYHLLQVLSKRLHCLVIGPPLHLSEMKHLDVAGAYGYCPTAASTQQLVRTIRKIARGKKYFHPTPPTELRSNLFVKRRPVFYKERLEEQAASIRWPLSEIELLILSQFDGANNDEIARRIHRPAGTVRSATSRIFFLLQQLSERREIPHRLVAFQVLLELGIIEYR
jgi:DNA-binding NarL/FixJ family response regulator